jgi:hypothetical protein
MPVTQVKSIGASGGIRAGRQLSNTDFTNIGLTAPRALWNLGSTADASGNAVTLTNGGQVTFGHGITGATTEAAIFAGTTSGGFLSAPNSIKQGYGSWGLWFRTPAKGAQYLMSMVKVSATDNVFEMGVESGALYVLASVPGSLNQLVARSYGTALMDDYWHFVGFTWDGQLIRLYVDGRAQYSSNLTHTGTPTAGPLYTGGTGLLYLGGREVDATPAFSGRIDEAFVTNQVLKEEHWRYLYAAKVAHGLSQPRIAEVNRKKFTKTSDLVSADFPSQPLVGYNFLTGALTTDNYGSLGKTLTNNGSIGDAVSEDGATGAVSLQSAGNHSFSASDASLPATSAARTIGIMMQYRRPVVSCGHLGYGTITATNEIMLWSSSGGLTGINTGITDIISVNGPDNATGACWVFFVYDNSDPGLQKSKLFFDGTAHSSVTTAVNTTLAGAGRFRIGERTDGTLNADQTVQNVFITNYAMRPEELRAIVDKPGVSLGTRSPLDPSDHILRIDDDYLYVVFDDVPGRDSVELILEGE